MVLLSCCCYCFSFQVTCPHFDLHGLWCLKIPLSLVRNKLAALDKWSDISLCHGRSESLQIQGKQGQAQVSFREPGLVWVEDRSEEGVGRRSWLSVSSSVCGWFLSSIRHLDSSVPLGLLQLALCPLWPGPVLSPGIQHGGDTVPAWRMSQSSVEDTQWHLFHWPNVFWAIICARNCCSF